MRVNSGAGDAGAGAGVSAVVGVVVVDWVDVVLVVLVVAVVVAAAEAELAPPGSTGAATDADTEGSICGAGCTVDRGSRTAKGDVAASCVLATWKSRGDVAELAPCVVVTRTGEATST